MRLLDHILPRGYPAPPPLDPVEEARELEVLTEGDEFAKWLQEVGVRLARGVDPDEDAKALLDALLSEEERLKRDLAATREVAAREERFGGPATARARRLEERLEAIDALTDRLWGRVHPPLIGHPSERPEPRGPRCSRCGKAPGKSGELLRAPGVGLCGRCKAKRERAPERDEIAQFVDNLIGGQ
jgi:hypothetical protein